jgi:UDP-glucose 4-epimerase
MGMDRGTILVTGGAGYIGSHTVLQLRARGERVVVMDNLYTGFRQAVLDTPLVVANVGDREQVLNTLRSYGVDTVMHFAAHTIVPESVADPLKYYGNNTCSTRNLLQCCDEVGIRHFVFSSTAAVYGIPAEPYADEAAPTAPINAYGTSKLMSEWMLRDLAAASKLRYVALRYFNVAGSDSDGRIGQSTREATLLVKVACQAVVGLTFRCSARTTPRPTARASAITSTWKTWRARIFTPWTTCATKANPRCSTAATATGTASARCFPAWSGSPGSLSR